MSDSIETDPSTEETAMNTDRQPRRLNPQEWEHMRVAFVTGDMTGKQLADLYGISPNTVHSRMARENWTQGRDGYQAELSTEQIAQRRQERLKAAALLDVNVRMIGASAIESISAGMKLTTDLSKLNAGSRAMANMVKLVREANHLPLERKPEPEPEPPKKPRVYRYLTTANEVKYVDLETNEFVEPTPGAFPLDNSIRAGAMLAMAGFAAMTGGMLDLLRSMVPVATLVRPTIVTAQPVRGRPALRLVPREEPTVDADENRKVRSTSQVATRDRGPRMAA